MVVGTTTYHLFPNANHLITVSDSTNQIQPAYGRILLKLSGEALMGENGYGIDPKVVIRIAQEVKDVHELGVEIALVVGGGNIFRGLSASAMGIDRASADYMGMLATVMNAIALQDGLEKVGVYTRVVSAIEMREVAEPFIRRRAVRHARAPARPPARPSAGRDRS